MTSKRLQPLVGKYPDSLALDTPVRPVRNSALQRYERMNEIYGASRPCQLQGVQVSRRVIPATHPLPDSREAFCRHSTNLPG